MSIPHLRKGIITMAYGELMLWVSAPIQGELSLPHSGPGVVTPLPAGITTADTGGMSGKELQEYLNYGMAFAGVFTLRNIGDGLKLTGATDLETIERPTPVQQNVLDGIMDCAEMLAGYRDARIKSGIKLSVSDWQGENRPDKTTADAIELTVGSEDALLRLSAKDGRRVEIELENGDLRVLAYESRDGKEFPVITSLPPLGEIETNRVDYDCEERLTSEEPEF